MSEQPTSIQIGIVVSNVSFSFGAKTVLAGVDLQIPVGEMWGLVGRSGTGKTTFLNIVAGLYQPENGDVTVRGRGGKTPNVRGVVFQDDSLLGWLTAKENVLFPNHSHPREETIREAQEIFQAVGLFGCEAAYPRSLSAGMRKRVEFARALISDSEYMLMDEPFGSVDALTRRELWALWFRLRQHVRRTGIISTHDPEEAIRMCDVVVTLGSSSPATVTNQIRIPSEIKQLGVSAQSEELWNIRNQIVLSLGQ
jgi:NitT/TauT family transport system ATP-binding protein